MALTDNLIGYWKLEEASGTRYDETANNLDLTDVNTVGQAVGKLGNAATFVPANSEVLQRASEANLQTGDIDFTFAAWVYISSKVAFMSIVTKDYNNTGTDREYLLFFNDADRLQFYVWQGAGYTARNVVASSYGSPATGAWIYVVAWHDATADTINIQVNNGTVDSAATGGALSAVTDAYFGIGARAENGAIQSLIWNGYIDSVGFWKRVLTAPERTSLYNSGNGLEYPFSGGGTAYLRNVNEIVDIAEATRRALALKRKQAETVDILETHQKAATWLRLIAETVNLSEASRRLMALRRTVAETLNILETNKAALALSRGIAETVDISEAVHKAATWLRLVAETVQIGEASNRAMTLARTVAETLHISEATGRLGALVQRIAETLNIIEASNSAFAQAQALVKWANETLHLREVASIAKWPFGHLSVEIQRGYNRVQVIGRAYLASVVGRLYRVRNNQS